MMSRLLLALLIALAVSEAGAQGTAPQRAAPQGSAPQGAGPQGLTRHGNWVEGRIPNPGREACIAGTPTPRQGSLQVTIGRGPSGVVLLVLAVQAEGARFTEDGTVRFTVDGRNFDTPGQVNRAGGPAMLVAASTDEEARMLSDLLVAMQRGRELRVQLGGRTLPFSLSGASPALNAMRTCAQRAGLMPQ